MFDDLFWKSQNRYSESVKVILISLVIFFISVYLPNIIRMDRTNFFLIVLITLVILLLCNSSIQGQVCLSQSLVSGKPIFALSTKQAQATICYDKKDPLLIEKVANLFAVDMKMVTGQKLEVSTSYKRGQSILIVGTVEKNSMIHELARKGKIDIAPLQGAWERYLIQAVDNPFPGIQKALVVAGSDRRGAAYGLFSLSELAGVSPWYWWADVPVKKHEELFINAPATYSKSPSVKYRGIFLNDEDWGLKPWAAKTFEKEHGNIGPRTYAKICELLLRLKANHLAPAMHPVSTAFYKIHDNKLVADTFAIVIGSSHCEPLLLNTASEWNPKEMGPWDYNVNKNKIQKVLSGRVKESCPYENIYTLALRGLHDAAMGVGISMKEKVRILGEALADQRKILSQHIECQPVESIPQAFTPYKEVLDIYSSGLEVPEDVTLIWPDDNFGYLKRLSSPEERKRSGRAGVYYHISYLGVPHSYLWFCTTPPALMYEELRKAYDTTADRIWLLNCGDLKGGEMQVSLFLDMAYDIDRFNIENIATYPARWLSGMFGDKNYKAFEDITVSHINLSFSRKPEFMGWGYWNNFWGGGEKRTDTEFSFANYNEAHKRLAEYERIANETVKLLESSRESERTALYQLLYYPTKGAELMNRMVIKAQIYRQYVRQRRSAANQLREEVKCCYDSLQIITAEYNSLLNGKWNYMMSMQQNYEGTSSYFLIPLMEEQYIPSGEPVLALQVEEEDVNKASINFHFLPGFNSFTRRARWVDIYNQGNGVLKWRAESSDSWIILSQISGNTVTEERIQVSVNWEKVPKGDRITGFITIFAGTQREQVLVSVFNPDVPSFKDLQGLYVEENGYVSIPAAGFHRKQENDAVKIHVINGLGIEGKAVQLGDPLAPLQIYRSNDAPKLEYDFYTFNAGLVEVYTYVLPTFPLHADRDFKLPEHTNTDTKYSVRIDNGSIATPPTSAVEYSQAWYESVLRNFRVNKSTLYVDKPGKHTLKICCGDPGTVIQKIVINLGGLKRSYLGPESTLLSR